MGAVSFTDLDQGVPIHRRCMARRTRASASGFFFMFIQTAWNHALVEGGADTPCISFPLRQDTGSRSRA